MTRHRPHPPAGHKYCADCKDFQPVEAFGKNASTADGLTYYCREHHTLRSKASNKRTRAKRKRELHETPQTPERGAIAETPLVQKVKKLNGHATVAQWERGAVPTHIRTRTNGSGKPAQDLALPSGYAEDLPVAGEVDLGEEIRNG